MKIMNAIVLIFVIVLAAQANAQTSSKDLFAGKCAICHSDDGSASTVMGNKLKIRSFHSPDVQSKPDADLKAMISKGKGAMPSFSGKLTDAQIDEMVIYVRGLGKK